MNSQFTRPLDVPCKAETLVELLRRRSEERPREEVYTFLDGGESGKVVFTYGELDERARAIAAHLQAVAARGERALLLYPPGLEFIAAFFGCLYAGVIAVPAYPPRLNRNLLRVQAIIADADATVTMTTGPILSKVKGMMDCVPELKGMKWLDTEAVGAGQANAWSETQAAGSDLAFLQYTSGSTGSPKGVMLGHDNLLHNASLVYRALNHTQSDKYVSWLPTFHDMGFMAGVLQPLYGGFPVVLMSPAAFLQSPIRWLQAITEYKGTTSGGPNFAYDLCVRKIPLEQRASLDLSSWNTAFNGAEPIRHETLERFIAAFEPCGFRREVFYPCYGLAEATLIVSGGDKSAPPVVKTFQAKALENNRVIETPPDTLENARTLVGCGSPLFEQRVFIVNPESRKLCAPDEVGEIWVSGPSVAYGYWNRPEQSEYTFQARLADTGEGPFLRTEDLGIMLDGELFVAGRIKDMVIIRGRNHYPQDIELTVERSHPALRPGCGAAFSVDVGDEERLVVVQEADNLPGADASAVIEAVRRAVSEEHELQVYATVLIKPGSIPKTSSGKIQRHAARNGFLSGELETVAAGVLDDSEPVQGKATLTREELLGVEEWSRTTLLESYLREQVARVLKVKAAQVNMQLPITAQGLDSLMSIELQYAVESSLGVNMPPAAFLQETSLATLASRILDEVAASSTPAQSLVPAHVEGATAPLSYGQQSLWFLYHLARESTAYNIARAVRIRSALDTRALRAAFQQLVERHPSLRTTFPHAEGRPVQLVHRSSEVAFEETDAADWSEESLGERLVEESHRPFDLENGPLLRVLIFKRATQQEHVLLLTIHHIVADFWSLAVLMHELGVLYEAQKSGAPAHAVLPALPASYVDYVRWQADMLGGPAGEKLWSYWRNQLAGELPVPNLPTDRPRPPLQTYRGASQGIMLSPQLSKALQSLSRKHGATLYMTLLASFQTLLHRYTGEEDIIVGSSTTGRSRSEFSGIVGYFVNPVALRADAGGDPTFEEFLGRVRRTASAAFEHQDYPLSLLVERLQPQRDPSRTPLFQVMFVLQKSHLLNEEGLASLALGEAGARLNVGGLSFESVALEQRVAQFDLTLMMAEAGDGLAASLEYNADLFDAPTVTRLLAHFQTLLEGIVARPQQRLSALPLITEAERHQILFEWNDTRVAYDRDRFVHQLFDEQAARTPDALAVVFENRHLSYGELARQSNELAHYLRSRGVGPEVRVGILLERAPELVVALLGVLKAGGAYVPLDPAYPQERLAFMLEDAQAAVLLTQRSLSESLPAMPSSQVVRVDADWPSVAGALRESQAANVAQDSPEAENTAYVIYTSGSSGRPKGVMVTHGGLLNYLNWCVNSYGATHGGGSPVHSSISFDLTVTSLYAPLLTGRPVVLLPEDGGVEALSSSLKSAADFSLVKITPVHLNILSKLLTPEEAAGRARVLVIGGEALFQDDLTFWREHAPGTRLINEYGPTETVVGCSVYDATAVSDVAGAVSIGRPVANTQLYVLDAHMRPVPPGVAGELYIGGAGLARGYLNRPGLTAEKFIPHPFGDTPGARLYRTGDLARYAPDGNIDFLGRIDRQVKIRGYRIELGEIESLLGNQAPVAEALVTVRNDGGAGARLVAYVVPSAGESLDTAALRERLQESLPDYMIPQAFVLLDELPLTPNGKVDLRALPPLAGIEAEAGATYVAPRNAVEETLAGIWSEVLGVGRIGIHDNFFALGGDSIISIQIISKARQSGISIAPRDLFRHQTVASLATAARIDVNDDRAAESLRREQLPVTGMLPLTPIQHWFFERNLPNPHHWNQSLLLEMRHALNPAVLEKALQQLLIHHDALRLRFHREGAGLRQVNADASEQISFRVVDLSTLTGVEQEETIATTATELQSSLDIERGPLCRAAYFKSGDKETNRLLLVIHHLVVDGVSWRILLEDLATAYRQLSGDEPVRLPSKTTSYRDWAVRLEEYARTGEAAQEADYWLRAFDKQVASLPVDFEDGANTEASAQTVSASLSEDETRALLQDVPAIYRAQINEVLLSALAGSFARWAKGALAIELEGHGREELFDDVDTSRTIGWFTSIFPVVLETETGARPEAVLRVVKEQLRGVPRRGIGYGILRYLRGDERPAAQLREQAQPLVSFNYLGQLDQVFNSSPLFKQALAGSGPTRDPHGARRYLLEINGSVTNGRLLFEWTYSRNVHRRETIEALAREFTDALKALLSRREDEDVVCYVPSDFPLARLDAAALGRIARDYAPVEDIYPLSQIQAGMLFHSLYAPASGVYVEQLGCTLRGNLDAAAFERAWRQVAQRYPTLRTAFVWENLDEPLQVVRRRAGIVWEHNDYRALSGAERHNRLESDMHSERARGFDLAEPSPPMRFMLNRTADDAYRFVWTYHHLLLDGWSLPIILSDVLAFYEALTKGQDLRLEPARPYSDYIRRLREQDLAGAETFWRKSLEGFTAPTPFGLDRPAQNSAEQDGDYEQRQILLADETTARLQSFARSHQLTLNTLLQGAWALMLSRYGGEPDVVFGVTVSGRSDTLAGVERMVGPFINTVPLRVRTPADAGTLGWLRELQESQSELRNYEYTPLVQIHGWSDVPRALPLFESIFVFENYPVDASLREMRGSLRIENVDFFERTNYPLMVQVVPGRELLLKVVCDRRRFDADAVERLLGHLQTLLLDIVARPAERLSRLRLLSEAERRRILFQWNDVAGVYPPESNLKQLFEAQAARTPDSIAVVFRERQLSYGELNRRANQLAHRLRRMGVGPEVLVGILSERSIEMVVGLLGIIKAGGAYVPLDPAYPKARLAFMLEDARAPVLLAQQGLDDYLPRREGRKVIYIDSEGHLPAGESDDNPATNPGADNPAYIIYTSGSTGRPKGVVIRHRSVAVLLRWAWELFTPEELSRVLASTSICFDLSVFELFVPLSMGGRVVLVENALDIGEAAAHEITLVNTVPSAMTELVGAACVPSSVRAVNLAGEALKSGLVRQIYEQESIRRVFNLYGPSEDTTYSTVALMPRDAETEPPIGRPISNTQVFLLDSHLEPVPVGITGELYIGGEGLARGYLNRPDATAEKFVPDPFGAVAGARLYRTGDLARYLSGGEIEYAGRVDQQVKIRGFRIEPGEIEAVMCAHEWVREAVVMAREDEPGDKRLVAYVTAGIEDGAECVRVLRAHLKERLPDYMVPAAFVLLSALPQTPNGKVDRQRLPAPEASKREPGAERVGGRNALEDALLRIWEEVLGVEHIGIHDNFFELGGHSLTAMQLLSRLRRAFSSDISLRDVLNAPDVDSLAKALSAHETEAGRLERLARALIAEKHGDEHAGARRGEVSTANGDASLRAQAITPRQSDDELPLSSAQQRLWFLNRLQPDVALYNCPAAVRLDGQLNADALVRSLNVIVSRHEILRTSFPATEKGTPIQNILPERPLSPLIVDLRELQPAAREAEARRVMFEEARTPFDLTRDPLLRVTLLRLDEEENVLMLTAHHIIVDAWSMGVLVRELAAIYGAFIMNEPSPLPPLPIQFSDFALWQHQWLQGDVLKEQSRYWKRVLSGRPAPLELPPVQPRPPARTHRGARRTFLIDAELASALHELSRREGVTLFVTLLAAFQTLLHRYTKQDDIIVGTAVASRPVGEVENLIGCFINTLALRTDFSGRPRFLDVLRRVQEVSLGALSNQDMPFEKLVDEIQPERSLSTMPIVQVAFGVQNSPMPALQLPGLRLTPLEIDDGVARLDLTLWIEGDAGGLKAAWTYSLDLFDDAAVKRMNAHYETLLRSITANPQARAEALEIMAEDEKAAVEARKESRKESNYRRLLKVKPKTINAPPRTEAGD